MTATGTDVAAATDRVHPPTLRASRSAVIPITVAGVVAFNLLMHTVGRAFGGAFTYTQSGKPNSVDAVAVTVLSAVPLTIGLSRPADAPPPPDALTTEPSMPS